MPSPGKVDKVRVCVCVVACVSTCVCVRVCLMSYNQWLSTRFALNHTRTRKQTDNQPVKQVFAHLDIWATSGVSIEALRHSRTMHFSIGPPMSVPLSL